MDIHMDIHTHTHIYMLATRTPMPMHMNQMDHLHQQRSRPVLRWKMLQSLSKRQINHLFEDDKQAALHPHAQRLPVEDHHHLDPHPKHAKHKRRTHSLRHPPLHLHPTLHPIPSTLPLTSLSHIQSPSPSNAQPHHHHHHHHRRPHHRPLTKVVINVSQAC